MMEGRGLFGVLEVGLPKQVTLGLRLEKAKLLRIGVVVRWREAARTHARALR